MKVKSEDITFALKVIKKKHVVDNRQEEHIHSERKILTEARSPFVVKSVSLSFASISIFYLTWWISAPLVRKSSTRLISFWWDHSPGLQLITSENARGYWVVGEENVVICHELLRRWLFSAFLEDYVDPISRRAAKQQQILKPFFTLKHSSRWSGPGVFISAVWRVLTISSSCFWSVLKTDVRWSQI